MKFNTKTIHGGQENVDPAYGSVMPPIYQTSTYSQSTPGGHKGFEYSRSVTLPGLISKNAWPVSKMEISVLPLARDLQQSMRY